MTAVAIAACWLGIAVVSCKIITGFFKWANTKQPVTGTREPYRSFEPDELELPEWVDQEEPLMSFTVAADGRLKEVWL